MMTAATVCEQQSDKPAANKERGGEKGKKKNTRKHGVELHCTDWWECAWLRSGKDREHEARELRGGPHGNQRDRGKQAAG